MLLFSNIKNGNTAATNAGLKLCWLLTQWAFFKKDPNGQYDMNQADEATVRAAIKTVDSSNVPLVLDLESWPLQGDMATIQATMDKMLYIIELFRAEAPGRRIGIYPVPPRSQWHAVYNYHYYKSDKTSKFYTEALSVYKWWQTQNKQYAKGRSTGKYSKYCLTDYVDFVCPDVYIPYATEDAYNFATTYIKEHIKASRLHRKQVYPYISPYIAGKESQLLPTKTWLECLETCKKYADGAIIYSSVALDENIEWWVATKDWMKAQQS